jgi:uncharacterized protein (TIGR03435 family)
MSIALAGRFRHSRIAGAGGLSWAKRAVAALVVLCLFRAPAIRAQFSTDWQARAGGKLAFEAASVRPGTGAPAPPSVPLTSWDEDIEAHGRFRASASLAAYIQFAYKLWATEQQNREFSHLPKWVSSDRYTIEARAAAGNPTKDQMRLMMQSLLADRFHLRARYADREGPVLYLKLAKAGKPGPKLTPHADGPSCDQLGPSPVEGLPGLWCHSLVAMDTHANRIVLMGSRDVGIDALAGALSTINPFGLGHPVIDQTGLAGKFDFTLEWACEPKAPAGSDAAAPADPEGPTLVDALRDELGLTLEPGKASLPVLVIDKVERPPEN